VTDPSDYAIEKITPPASAPPRPQDLSAEICCAVEKLPGDSVRCTYVSNGHYRCNWWAPQPKAAYDNPGMGGLLVTTHRVRESRFLHVTKVAGRLVIREKQRTSDDYARQ
jgi:hypothetical protein